MNFKIDWTSIDTVLLDMDGTLLDLNYDRCFWNEKLPLLIANEKNQAEEDIKKIFQKELIKLQGTIDWYSTTFWSEFFSFDILKAKEKSSNLIRTRPYTDEFLKKLRDKGKQTIIVTNAHPDVIALKLKYIPLHKMTDKIISSHEFDAPKEDSTFWPLFFKAIGTEPNRTIFFDDTLSVLQSAHNAGIREVIEICKPDLSRPPKKNWNKSIIDFNSIISSLESNEGCIE